MFSLNITHQHFLNKCSSELLSQNCVHPHTLCWLLCVNLTLTRITWQEASLTKELTASISLACGTSLIDDWCERTQTTVSNTIPGQEILGYTRKQSVQTTGNKSVSSVPPLYTSVPASGSSPNFPSGQTISCKQNKRLPLQASLRQCSITTTEMQTRAHYTPKFNQKLLLII